MIAPYH